MADEQTDFSRIPDPEAWRALAGARRVRLFCRLSALALMAAGGIMGGVNWVLGAFLGGLVVEFNASLLVRVLSRSEDWKGRTLWPTLFQFYLTFGATALACLLVVRQGWGHPLAFLMGLFSFFLGLVLGLVSLAVKKPVAPHEP